MSLKLENLDLIDLISERHLLLRSLSEKMWNDSSDIYISNTEWFIMSRIYKSNPTISCITKHVGISRQAVHKFVKSLESKGLVEVTKSKNNNKDKCLNLTTLGEECYEKNLSLKADLEVKIANKLGVERYNLLNDILKTDWGI